MAELFSERQNPVEVQAILQDVLTPLHVGAVDAPPICTGCGRDLPARYPITAYAYRLSDDPAWGVRRVFCEACGYTELEAPTLGA